MKFLIDTNIFLEVMLNQQHAQEAKSLLQESDIHEYFISDFSLHSIALILLRRRAFNLLERFIADTVRSGSIRVLGVPPDDLMQVVDAAQQHGLDFDDAYQYVLALQHELPIISFDSDFDRTPLGRQRPNEI
jgi:predicted nucleic acid-binding protein